MNKDINKLLKESIDILSNIDETDIVSDLLCVLAAITDTESPRADLSYSAIMRKLRKEDKELMHEFQVVFKDAFDDALDADLENPERVALLETLHKVNIPEL